MEKLNKMFELNPINITKDELIVNWNEETRLPLDDNSIIGVPSFWEGEVAVRVDLFENFDKDYIIPGYRSGVYFIENLFEYHTLEEISELSEGFTKDLYISFLCEGEEENIYFDKTKEELEERLNKYYTSNKEWMAEEGIDIEEFINNPNSDKVKALFDWAPIPSFVQLCLKGQK